MDIILVVLLVLLVGIASAILYLNLKSKPKDENNNIKCRKFVSPPQDACSLMLLIFRVFVGTHRRCVLTLFSVTYRFGKRRKIVTGSGIGVLSPKLRFASEVAFARDEPAKTANWTPILRNSCLR